MGEDEEEKQKTRKAEVKSDIGQGAGRMIDWNKMNLPKGKIYYSKEGEKMKFKEGDIVKVIGKYGSYGEEWEKVHWVDAMDYTIGEQGHVEKGVEFCGARYLVEFPNGNEWWYCEDSLVCIGANPWTVDDAGDAGIYHIWVNKAKGATTVKFIDGSTITVRKSKDTPFDVYYAVASAVAEKIYGSNHAFQRIIEKNTTYQKPKEKKVPAMKVTAVKEQENE